MKLYYPLVAVILGGLLLGIHSAAAHEDEAPETVIRITADGFFPRNIEISPGAAVRWINADSESHWPASNPHPSHENLAGFDPQKSLTPGEKWEFRFEKAGEWRYHDHLRPHRMGKIAVISVDRKGNGENQPRTPKIIEIKENLLAGFLDNFGRWIMDIAFRLNSLYLPEKNPEIAALVEEKDPAMQNKLVRRLLDLFPPRQVQEMLKSSGLPFTGESHFVIHTIGDWLYENYGVTGLKECTDYFLSGCYHGLILHELGDHGTERLPEIMAKCEKAGFTVAAQCSHGLGHGFLAWLNYDDLIAAFRMCDIFDSTPYVFNCHDGVSMENLVAVYDGSAKEKRWIKKDDPLYPCNAVPKKYQPGCWSNQASLLFMEVFPGNLKKVAEICDSLTDKTNQEVCYDNFSRQINPLTQGKTQAAIFYCETFATGIWKEKCLLTNMMAAFSVGDREKMPYEICRYVSQLKDDCYQRLAGIIAIHYAGERERGIFCNKILEDQYIPRCSINAAQVNMPY